MRCLQQTVPAAVPGIALLSGGQGDEQAIQYLNAMNQMAAKLSLPWRLTFSYERALQNQLLEIWRGDALKAEQTSQYPVRQRQPVLRPSECEPSSVRIDQCPLDHGLRSGGSTMTLASNGQHFAA